MTTAPVSIPADVVDYDVLVARLRRAAAASAVPTDSAVLARRADQMVVARSAARSAVVLGRDMVVAA